jgi:hypothetical protein
MIAKNANNEGPQHCAVSRREFCGALTAFVRVQPTLAMPPELTSHMRYTPWHTEFVMPKSKLPSAAET